MVLATGAAPRWRGRSDGWTLSGGREPKLEQVPGHELPVRDEDQPIRRPAAERVARLVRTEPIRRQDADAVLARERRDRRCAQLEAAAGRTIGLADDEEVVGALRHAGEQRNPEGSRAEETDATDARH